MNVRSQSTQFRPRVFTIVAAALWLLASPAQADRVLVLSPRGAELTDEQVEEIDAAISAAVRAVGHSITTETLGGGEPPTTANEMRAIAEVQGARYLIATTVNSATEGTLDLLVRVAYAPETRLEELRVTLPPEAVAERLRDVMAAMLQPAGLGDAGGALIERWADADRAAADNARLEEATQREADARAERERIERERQEAADRERTTTEERRSAWDDREWYGDTGTWMAGVGFALRPIIAHGDARRDGGWVMGTVFRLGRRLAPGLELRGELDLAGGAAGGFSLTGGIVYLYSFFTDLPLFIGAGAHMGMQQAVTGNRVPALAVRITPMAVWRVVSAFHLEAALLDLQVLSSNGGVVTLGMSVGASLRF